jgi:putative transposase
LITELRTTHGLDRLLGLAGLSRSSYYYHSHLQADRYVSEKQLIQDVYHQHKGRYGYRRIGLALKRLGVWLNHKTVQKLMQQLQLKSIVREKKYKSYKGPIGKVAPNQLARQFQASSPNEKWVTDVTEFNILGDKVYLSPILDLYNGEIVSYEVAQRPQYSLVDNMLRQAISRLKPHEKPMLHSDQGWQYQMAFYQTALQEHGLTQSMSRKGNCLDNAVMENFFGLVKTEFYYTQKFKDVATFIKELKDYIWYYNHERIKTKLKGLSPVEYRNQSLSLNQN